MNLAARLRQHPRPSFATAALLVLGAYALAIPWLARHAHEPLPDWTLAIDLLLVLPLLYWWLQPAPRGRAAGLGALAVALAGIWVGAWLLPAENKQVWLWLEPLRWVVIGALVLVQLALATLAIRQLAGVMGRLRQAMKAGRLVDGLVETELHAVLEAQAARTARVTGQPVGGALRWVQLEARLWLYALAPRRWLDATPAAGEQWFGVHRQGQNLSNQMGFVVLAAVEIPIVHVLLHLMWSPLVAGIVTALSVYGALFLWAEARATRWRPVALDATTLHLRHGLVVDVQVPRTAIVAAVVHRGATPARASGRLHLVGMGRAKLHLTLAPGTRLALLTGEREVHELFIGVDEPERLQRALSEPGTHTP
jgi:hypothetical protein